MDVKKVSWKIMTRKCSAMQMFLIFFLLIFSTVDSTYIHSWEQCYCKDSKLTCKLDLKYLRSNLNCSLSSILNVKNGSIDSFPYLNEDEKEFKKCNDTRITECKVNGDSTPPPILALDISENSIRDISLIPKKCSIVVMNLANNLITNLGDHLSHCSDLEGLNIVGNKLKKLSSHEFLGLKNLQVLDLSQNPLVFLPVKQFSELSSLEILRVTDTNLMLLPSKIFENLTNLRFLDLSNNKYISYILKNTFHGLKNLQYLSLKNNDLWFLVPGLFRHQHRLLELDLSENYLHHMSESVFLGLDSLRVLRLHNNFITTLPPLGRMCPQLEIARLDNNSIISLREAVVRRAACSNHTMYLILTGNPVLPQSVYWTCSSPKVNVTMFNGNEDYRMNIQDCHNSTLLFSTKHDSIIIYWLARYEIFSFETTLTDKQTKYTMVRSYTGIYRILQMLLVLVSIVTLIIFMRQSFAGLRTSLIEYSHGDNTQRY